MLKAQWCPYSLKFRFEAQTSRAKMLFKDTYFIRLYDSSARDVTLGVGECALFKGLSADDRPDYEELLSEACENPLDAVNCDYSSIRFGFETALSALNVLQWRTGCLGLPTNGLIWMGDKATMAARIDEKLAAGFKVLKLKIGGINFEDELELLAGIRRRYAPETLEIRLDANGSFTPDDALCRLGRLAPFSIHSIEQPVRAGQPEAMASICRESPIPVCLDEELIGCRNREQSKELVEMLMPKYLILKPSLCGGFKSADTYIDIADELGIGWWATSALESNVGLMAIAEWVASKNVSMPQGLGTGQLYENNFQSPLEMRGERLYYRPGIALPDLSTLQWR